MNSTIFAATVLTLGSATVRAQACDVLRSYLPAATLTYSITGGADAASFTINSSTGALSFAAAVNRGITRARFARTCLLNNDMVLEPGFFAALTAAFAKEQELFAATAQIFFPEGARREETGKAMYHRNKTGQFPVWCEMPLPGWSAILEPNARRRNR